MTLRRTWPHPEGTSGLVAHLAEAAALVDGQVDELAELDFQHGQGAVDLGVVGVRQADGNEVL